MAALLYDDDCGICIWIAALVLRFDRRQRLRPVAIRSVRGRSLLSGMSRSRRLGSWHLVDDRGRRSSGGRAVLALAALFAPRWAGVPGRIVAKTAAIPLALLYGPLAAERSKLSVLVPEASKRRSRRVVRKRARR